MKKTSQIIFSIFLILAHTLIGCSGKEVDQNDPKAIYEDAEEDIADKRYSMALEKMKNLKNKFPYSNYAKIAQLRIADIHYLDEAYIEAAASYELFRDLYPKHEKIDYVIFKIGESYLNQLPSTIDRDLSPGLKAISAYEELQTLYPKSQYIEDAKKHLQIVRGMLSDKEAYIADFYYKNEQYDSAAKRYEKIINKYSGTKNEERAFFYWGESLIKQSKTTDNESEKNALLGEAKHVFLTYERQFPEGKYIAKVKTYLKEIEN
jgi:outer membrane protein assembly factor BamD